MATDIKMEFRRALQLSGVSHKLDFLKEYSKKNNNFNVDWAITKATAIVTKLIKEENVLIERLYQFIDLFYMIHYLQRHSKRIKNTEFQQTIKDLLMEIGDVIMKEKTI